MMQFIQWLLGNVPTKSEQIRMLKIHVKYLEDDNLNLFRKITHPVKETTDEFVECASCNAKPGSPILCESCINNRDAIAALKTKLRVLKCDAISAAN